MKYLGEDPKDEERAKLTHSSASCRFGSPRLGQSPVLSHTLIIGFSVILVLIIVTSMASIKEELQDFIGKSEIKQVCALVKGGIESVFHRDNYISPMNESKGTAKLKLPGRIADLSYRARFSGSELVIETFGINMTDTCKMGFNATYLGSTSGGVTLVNFTEYSGRTMIVRISKA